MQPKGEGCVGGGKRSFSEATPFRARLAVEPRSGVRTFIVFDPVGMHPIHMVIPVTSLHVYMVMLQLRTGHIVCRRWAEMAVFCVVRSVPALLCLAWADVDAVVVLTGFPIEGLCILELFMERAFDIYLS